MRICQLYDACQQAYRFMEKQEGCMIECSECPQNELCEKMQASEVPFSLDPCELYEVFEYLGIEA